MPDQDLLDVYLNDHFAGATAGVELAKRLAGAGPQKDALAEIAGEIESDRETLRAVMTAAGVNPSRLKVAAGWVGEKAGRLKLNDRVLGRSPLSNVLEFEVLISGVSGKLQLWRTLALLSRNDTRLRAFDFEALAARAEDQRNRLEQLHADAARPALRA